jgi:hypothetical protein
MTALRDYQRLEASGRWRAAPQAERRDVVVSMGEATLTITDLQDRALAHWSLAAIERRNPGQTPAVYAPDGDPGETLELGPDEATMIEAIETLRQAIARGRPRAGRLRLAGVLGLIAALGVAAVLWLPDALLDHTARALPEAKRDQISAALLDRIAQTAGAPCQGGPDSRAALQFLAQRSGAERVLVLPDLPRDSLHLPDGTILLHRRLLEEPQDPALAAGFILAEGLRAGDDPPFHALLDWAGLGASLQLLTAGDLSPQLLDRYAARLLSELPEPPRPEALRAAFDAAELPLGPYAEAAGLSDVGLAPPAAGNTAKTLPLVLRDRDWVLLQGLCDT